jgi:hypothetical protein
MQNFFSKAGYVLAGLGIIVALWLIGPYIINVFSMSNGINSISANITASENLTYAGIDPFTNTATTVPSLSTINYGIISSIAFIVLVGSLLIVVYNIWKGISGGN